MADESLGRVIVVDDEGDLVSLICDSLRSAGFEAFGFTEAGKALGELKRVSPAVVFTDINMPKMDGYQFLRACRQEDPELPVVFVTGRLTKDGLLSALRDGIFHAIEKPFKEAELIETAQRAVRRYEQLKQLK